MWWSCHLMRCDCLCCVMSRDAMRCHVMCAHVMCPAMVTLCVRSGSVTMWWSKVLFCTKSTTVYYKVLLQYYSVLQCTTPVLLCTTTHYNVLHQYYSVLQSTTLLCTTKCYSSTTLYYKVLLQYYSVLQSTTPVLLCTTQYYNVLLQDYPVLQSAPAISQNVTKCCAWYEKSHSNFIKYCACHAKWISSLIRLTYETSFTMRGATRVSLPLHQILRLPRKMNLMIDPHQIWNVIYNARSNTGYRPTSPNTAPATKFWVQDFSAKSLNCFRQYKDDSTMIRAWNRHLAPAASETLLVRSWRQFCIEKYNISRSGWLPKCHEMLRLPRKVTLQLHQILCLPRKMNLIIDPPHIWNVIYNARSNKCHPPTSPNTAPATQNESHDWSASDMKRHLQCAEQAMSTSNLSKYCACHEIIKFKIAAETLWIASANIKTIRG